MERGHNRPLVTVLDLDGVRVHRNVLVGAGKVAHQRLDRQAGQHAGRLVPMQRRLLVRLGVQPQRLGEGARLATLRLWGG